MNGRGSERTEGLGIPKKKIVENVTATETTSVAGVYVAGTVPASSTESLWPQMSPVPPE